MKLKNKKNDSIARNIFSGSTTMTGVCITIIALYRATKETASTYTDEILSINTFVFITAAFFAYLTLRNESNEQTERIADILFFTGMSVMLIVGIMIVYLNL